MQFRLRRAWLAPFVLVALGAPFAIAADDVPENPQLARIVELASHDNQVMDHLDYLTNKIGGRLTGSTNLAKAYEWTKGKFEEFGLKNVHTEVWGEYPIGFDRAGPSTARAFASTGEPRTLTIGSFAWTAGTNGPVRGPAIFEPTTKAELEAVKDKLKGAWILAKTAGRGRMGGGGQRGGRRGNQQQGQPGQGQQGQPGQGQQDQANPHGDANPHADLPKADQPKADQPKSDQPKSDQPPKANPGESQPRVDPQAQQRERAEIRTALEAAGIAGYVRGVSGDLILTDGRPSGITINKLPKTPQVNTTNADWKFIADELNAGRKVELEIDVRNHFFAGPVQHKNVIAEIPGTEKPDEVVIVGGHLDSWDGAQGATDNGTGVATTLEAARLLAKTGAKPKRTIRFILWSGEEQGLLGSAGYVKTHKDELPKISCILIHDGGTNYVSGIGLTHAMYPLVAPALAPLANLDKDMPFKTAEVDSLPYGVGSDHDTFLSVGVPGFFWRQTGKQNYDHEHHTQYDTYAAAIPEYQKHSAVTIAGGALAIANLDRLLPRDNLIVRNARGGGRKTLGIYPGEDMTIEGIVPDGRAEKAGLKEGDKIVKIGSKPVTNMEELREALQAAEGETEIRFIRDGKELVAKTVFEAPKAERRWY